MHKPFSRRKFCQTLTSGCIAGHIEIVFGTNLKADDSIGSWKKISNFDAAELAKRHIHGLLRATHSYHQKHGTLPPAVISNPKLPAGKRLSGLVLLLPHLSEKSYMVRGEPCFDQKTIDLGLELYESIDQSKAWDDPANLKAARTLMPAFLAPQSGRMIDDDGFAVSHFAFVKGSSEGTDGAFPGEKGIKIAAITDGTVSTLGLGQINEDLGPWLAEGRSTARQLFAATKEMPASFGSDYGKGAMFATVDSMAGFFPLNRKTMPTLQEMATRSSGGLIDFKGLRMENPFQEKAAVSK